DVDGLVHAINMRSTEGVTDDNIAIIVPNSEFIAGRVVNWSHGDATLRLRLPVGVSHRADVEHVQEVLLDAAARGPDVLREPAPAVEFVRFGPSSLDLELQVWIANPRYRGRVLSALHFAVRRAFLDEGIEIALPQYDVHFHPDAPPDAAKTARARTGLVRR